MFYVGFSVRKPSGYTLIETSSLFFPLPSRYIILLSVFCIISFTYIVVA